MFRTTKRTASDDLRRSPPRGSGGAQLLALVGGLVLVGLGAIAIVELASTWHAVLLALDSIDSRSTGGGWRTGDGLVVSRARWLGAMSGHTVAWGGSLGLTALYGARVVAEILAGPHRKRLT